MFVKKYIERKTFYDYEFYHCILYYFFICMEWHNYFRDCSKGKYNFLQKSFLKFESSHLLKFHSYGTVILYTQYQAKAFTLNKK